MFWVDQIVEQVVKQCDKDDYVVTDWKTPSGHIHVGALRGVLIHGCVARGLSMKGKKVLWQYGFDDADPMDALPVYLPESYKKFMGKPLALIPSPKAGHSSFGEYYASEFQEVFESLGEKPAVVHSYALYRQGIFNAAIKIVLDEAKKIREIYLKVTNKKQPDDWLPIQMICESCGRIGTTRAYSWDGMQVAYKCEENWVKYTKGCGLEGKRSPFDGNAKLPWRVEWPAKWYTFKTDVEGAGKDHQTKGGSHDMAEVIYQDVFHGKPPYNIPYEFFLVHGEKMSSSRGIGSTAKEVTEVVPPNLTRFLMIMTRPNRAINFSPAGDTIPRLYDEFDRASQIYAADPASDLGRLFSYSGVKPSPISRFHYRFNKVAYLIQMPHIDVYIKADEEKGSKLTNEEKVELSSRIEYAKKWLNNYAPAEFKITIKEDLPEEANNLTQEQKEFLHQLVELINSQSHWNGQELHSKIHELKQTMNLQSSEAFAAIYLSILGKPSGPQAGWFLAALKREFVARRFQEV